MKIDRYLPFFYSAAGGAACMLCTRSFGRARAACGECALAGAQVAICLEQNCGTDKCDDNDC
jgi:hypothetical protein